MEMVGTKEDQNYVWVINDKIYFILGVVKEKSHIRK
mgnify:FL=1